MIFIMERKCQNCIYRLCTENHIKVCHECPYWVKRYDDIDFRVDSKGNPYIEIISSGDYTSDSRDGLVELFIDRAKKNGVFLRCDLDDEYGCNFYGDKNSYMTIRLKNFSDVEGKPCTACEEMNKWFKSFIKKSQEVRNICEDEDNDK